MKIRSKLSGAFILLLMLMLLIGGLAIKQLGDTDELTDVIQNNTIPSIEMAGKMDTLLQKKRLLVMRFISIKSIDELPALLAENKQGDELMSQLWEQYTPVANSAQERQALNSFQSNFKQYAGIFTEKLIPLVQANDKENAYALIPAFRDIAKQSATSIEQLIAFN